VHKSEADWLTDALRANNFLFRAVRAVGFDWTKRSTTTLDTNLYANSPQARLVHT